MVIVADYDKFAEKYLQLLGFDDTKKRHI